jgi:nucleoid-associated protein YgaU
MPKDLKIGLAVGMCFVILAVLWLATRPSLTPQARLASASARQTRSQYPHNTDAQKETGTQSDSRYSSNENQEVRIDKPESSIQKPESNIQNPVTSIENPESGIRNEQTEAIKTEKFYVVRKNDTLSSISQKYYGSATKWPKIFDANRKTIPDANKLPIGAKLIIPD